MRRVAAVCIVLVAAAGVQASTIEETTGVKYQHDGGTHGDASDVCVEPSPVLPVGNETEGLLVPLDDPEDDYGLDVTEADIGEAITVTLTPGPPLDWAVEEPLPDYDLVVHTPDCQEPINASRKTGSVQEIVTFVPEQAGVHVIQVLPGDGDLPGVAPVPMGCHPTCVGTTNKLVGYDLTSSQ